MALASDASAETDFETKELEHLANIEGELEEIRKRTPTGFRALLNGILSGGGAIIGGIAAVILLGWILSLFGVLPGFSRIAAYLQDIVSKSSQYR